MLKRTLTSAAVAAALAFAAAPASAEFMDFKVDETSVPGVPVDAPIFTADKLNGGYEELVSITGANSFAAQAFATFTSFRANEATSTVESFAGAPNSVGGYSLYAVFSATGTFVGSSFTGVTGAFTLYIDPDKNTTATLTDGIVAPTLAGTGDDYEIASTSSLVNGTGSLSGPPGAFDFIFKDFELTDAGKLYFVHPNPFYIRTQVNGDIDQFSTTSPFFVTGDVSAVFVPEPGTLALAGLALGAMGFVTRRRRAA